MSNIVCSKCGNTMDRISRNASDHQFSKMTLGLYKVRRYLCHACLHERRVIKRAITELHINWR